MRLLAALVFLATKAAAFTEYGEIIPNSLNVVVNGTRVVGLGHADLTSGFVSTGNANQFGIDVQNADREFGLGDPAGMWAAVCDLDSDGDGIPNKDELCDPDCNQATLNPECPEGQELTHPGFPSGKVEAVALHIEYTIHGVCMVLAWIFVAPYGILRAMIYKKRPQKTRWFKDHKYALLTVTVLTWFGFLAMVEDHGVDAIGYSFEEFPNAKSHLTAPHVISGVFVLAMATAQPISGYFRAHLPKNGEEKSLIRKLWEFQHQWLGRICFILAVYTVRTGMPLIWGKGKGWGNAFVVFAFLGGIASFAYVLFFRERHIEYLKAKMEDEEAQRETNKSAVISTAHDGPTKSYSHYNSGTVGSTGPKPGQTKRVKRKPTEPKLSEISFAATQNPTADVEQGEEEKEKVASRVSGKKSVEIEKDLELAAENEVVEDREEVQEKEEEPKPRNKRMGSFKNLAKRVFSSKPAKSDEKPVVHEGPQVSVNEVDVEPHENKLNVSL